MRIAFFTLGCKVNQYETQIMSNQFLKAGFKIVNMEDGADVYVINSCTVTSAGDKKSKQLIRKLKRQNQNAIIALTGCFPQAFPDDAGIIAEADIIQGSYNRASLLENVNKVIKQRQRIIDITPHKKGERFEPMSTNQFDERTRAFVKIEDGCDRFCTYCIIPTARGPIRSKPFEEIKQEVNNLVANGYKEIVLVGINLSSYGKDMNYDLRLIDVIEKISKIDGLKRIRLGSLEPELLTENDLDRLAKLENFCDQFHLSLQSGCDDTLERMRRRYNATQYHNTIQRIRQKFKNPAITTDIMVGFPGETDEEFNKSLDFAKKVKFAKAHVFSYSKRTGTKAATMQNQIDKPIKEKRSKLMLEVTRQSQFDFLKSQEGTIQEVLFETVQDKLFVGYTKNYTKVMTKADENICGKIFLVEILKAQDDYCLASICK